MDRKQIQKLESEIRKEKEASVNEAWKRMFDQLLVALDHWDAMIARTEEKSD